MADAPVSSSLIGRFAGLRLGEKETEEKAKQVDARADNGRGDGETFGVGTAGDLR